MFFVNPYGAVKWIPSYQEGLNDSALYRLDILLMRASTLLGS